MEKKKLNLSLTFLEKGRLEVNEMNQINGGTVVTSSSVVSTTVIQTSVISCGTRVVCDPTTVSPQSWCTPYVVCSWFLSKTVCNDKVLR